MTRVALVVLHAFIAVGAVPAAILYITNPSNGGPLSSDTAWLDGSPFGDYLIPGLFLGFVIGGGNLLAGLQQAKRSPYAPYVSALCGLILAAWIVIQASIIPFNWVFHPSFFGMGLVMMALAFLQLRRGRQVQPG